mgnify:FL=1
MDIKQVVIHELLKEKGKQEADKTIAKKVLDTQSDLVVKLVSSLGDLYGTKGNNAMYGTFSRKDESNLFPKQTDKYLKNESDDEFFALSKQCMVELVRESRAQQSATGGYIIFARYRSMKDFLLVAMIKSKHGLNVNKDLEPEDVIEIDLSKIHQAARINLTTYAEVNSLTDDNSSDNEEPYLSFVSPTRNSEVSGYFRKALDCTDGVRSGRATSTAFSTVKDYCNSKPNLKKYKLPAKDSLIQYFEECLSNGQPATLEGVEHCIKKVLPVDIASEAEGFSEFANNEENQLPHTFGVNKSSLTNYTRIRSKTADWKLSFERVALGTDDNSPLYFDGKDKLIIQCPEDLKKQIEEQLKSESDEQG